MNEESVAILNEINENLRKMNEKIDILIEIQEKSAASISRVPGIPRTDLLKPIDSIDLLNLPDRLRKIAQIMVMRNRAAADEIAKEIKSTRESASERLNELVTLGYLAKERGKKQNNENARKTYFYTLEEDEEENEEDKSIS